MPNRRPALTCLAAWAAICLALLDARPARAQDEEFFERKIRPVLAGTCFRCHGGERTSAKLRIDSRQALLKGGKSGPALVPGDPDRSLLVQVLRPTKDIPTMPPGQKPVPAVAADFAAWVKKGAPWPATTLAHSFAATKHWAFGPLRDAAPPAHASLRQPIDRFLAAAWQQRGLSPVGTADRRTLIRRATFDLLGLPPTPDEVTAFVDDVSPAAYAKLIDRLLASPHYGERWGRHWLDVVRFADSAGETADFPVPDAWRYRNYVIAAFNTDMPYDQFLREQLAGDLLAQQLPAPAPPGRYEDLVVATGYIAIARRFGFDVVADHYLTIEDTIDVLGKSVLGLTIGCARCHDHKYDPVSANDYYALYGIFDSTRYPFPGCEKTRVPKDLVALTPPTMKPQPRTTGPKTLIATGQAYAVAEGKPHDVPLQKRGDPNSHGAVVPRRFLELFGGQPVTAPDRASGRLQLAGWLTEAAGALAARVMVNRIWQHHFGVGLVKTPNDFGTRGEAPSHPELIDYLAGRFIASGWSVKAMHRLIMNSEAYRRGSDNQVQGQQVDPANVYLWRFARRRLSAEEIRDAILAVSGDLDRSRGGAHPFPDAKTWQFTQHNPFAARYDHDRRSVYLMTQRIKRHPFLALFDGPDANASSGTRHSTTVPTQALFFMNDPFVHAHAKNGARRLLGLPTDAQRLDLAYQRFYGRLPTDAERAVANQFLDASRREPVPDPALHAWAAWLRVMLSANEFIHVD